MMTLQEIHDQAINYSGIKYDQRLSAGMNELQFEDMRSNNGCNYYFYLHNLVKILKPKKIVELGTSIGRSAAFMMLALPEGSTLTTVEMGSFMRTDLEPFYEDPRLSVVYGSDVDPEVYGPLACNDIDFLFIDTLHEYEHVMKEWSIYRQFLAKDALVIMDDIHLSQGMSKAWNEMPISRFEIGDKVHFSGFGMFKNA